MDAAEKTYSLGVKGSLGGLDLLSIPAVSNWPDVSRLCFIFGF